MQISAKALPYLVLWAATTRLLLRAASTPYKARNVWWHLKELSDYWLLHSQVPTPEGRNTVDRDQNVPAVSALESRQRFERQALCASANFLVQVEAFCQIGCKCTASHSSKLSVCCPEKQQLVHSVGIPAAQRCSWRQLVSVVAHVRRM